MNQRERRECLINMLLGEQPRFRDIVLPPDEQGQRDLLRSLMNVRLPAPLPEGYAAVESDYLKEAIAEKGVTRAEDLNPVEEGLYLWQGDITTLACDAIVNAANSQLLGCFQPLHSCIDNCIHTYAGLGLRNACADIMEKQGTPEPAGQAKITPAFNLPCRWVIHTVGPIVQGPLTKRHETQLASCYRACLNLALENGCETIAFCCISTGVFSFPQRRAAEIAVETVRAWQKESHSPLRVIFNVFKDADAAIYRDLLAKLPRQ